MSSPLLPLQVLVAGVLSGCCMLECVGPIKPITPYMEKWAKEGMTADSRRADWVVCDGGPDGWWKYYIPPGTPVSEWTEISGRAKAKLDRCLQSKGYSFRQTE